MSDLRTILENRFHLRLWEGILETHKSGEESPVEKREEERFERAAL